MNKGYYALVGVDRKYNEKTLMTLSHESDIKYMYDMFENLWNEDYELWRELKIISFCEDGLIYVSEERKHYWGFEEREKQGF